MMRAVRHRLPHALIATTLLLASCAKPPPKVYAPPPFVPTIMPLPPMGSAEDLDLPEIDAQGIYITPNRGMTGQQALWHVRMALNVAALSCRDAGDVMGTEYNRMLRTHALALAQANAAADAIFKLKYADPLAVRDKIYTVVYNYFALPPAQKAFCPTARAVVTTINGLPSNALLGYAPKALEMLEKPFQDFWAAYADYLRRLEEWRRRYARPSVQVLPCPDSDPQCGGNTPPPPVAPTLTPMPPMTLPPRM